jgi:hypothetical protein
MGQGVTIKGDAHLDVKDNATITIVNQGNFEVEDNGSKTSSISIDGDVDLDGNWTNNSASTLDISDNQGNISFSGSSTQYINGTSKTQFSSITIQNDVELGVETQINTLLSIGTGDFLLSNYNLTLTSGATISGYSATYNIITNGTGELKQYLISGGSQVTFPVASNTSYTPVFITQNTGNSSYFNVRVIDGVWSDGTSGTNLALTDPVVNRTWLIDSDETPDADIVLQWNLSDEVNGFDRDAAFGANYDSGWENDPTTITGNDPYQVNFSNITTLNTDHPHSLSDANDPLAIELLYFNAKYQDGEKLIEWATVSENGSAEYILYASIDTENWSEIYRTPAAIYSNQINTYNTIDKNSYTSEIIYYKLVEKELNGNLNEIGIQQLLNTNIDIEISSYINQNNQLIIQLNQNTNQDYQVFLYNNLGQHIECLSSTSGSIITIDMNGYSKGIYIINLRNSKGQSKCHRLIL